MMFRNAVHFRLMCIFAAFSFLQTSCSQDITLATRSMTDRIPIVSVPGAPLPGNLGLSLGLAINSTLIGIEADSKFLTFARLRNLRLEIQESSDVDGAEDGAQDSFDFLSELTVSIRGEINGISQEQIIALLPEGDPQIGTAARVLDLVVLNADVLDFLQAPGGYQLVLNLTGTVPPDAVVLGGSARYRVGVGF